VKVGDLVRTPRLNNRNGDRWTSANRVFVGSGFGYYDWEDKVAIVVGFNSFDEEEGDYIEVRIQESGKLCLFSRDTLTRVG